MTAEEKYEHWKAYAERDLDGAEAMLNSGRWFFVVFCCQQAVEKLVKGLYVMYIDDNVPRVHNITKLMERFEDKLPMTTPDKYNKLFKLLTGYYVSDRYPDYISKIGEQINKEEATKVFNESKEAFAWLLTLKPQEE